MDSYGGFYDSGKEDGVSAGGTGGDAHGGRSGADEAATPNPHIDTKYVQELNAEKTMLDHETFPHSIRLVSHEINRVTLGGDQLLDLFNDKTTKVAVKVRVPVQEFPKFNFIGKLLGPKGNTLKRLQDESGCRMAVYGRGSMRDKDKEEELRQQGGKYAHLSEDLHVYIESYGHPIDVYRRVSMALHAVRRHLVPDYNDDITQHQVQELAFLNGRAPAPLAPRGPRPMVGLPPPPPHMMGGAGEFGAGPGAFPRPSYTDIRGGRGGVSAGLGRGLGARGGGPPNSLGTRRGAGGAPGGQYGRGGGGAVPPGSSSTLGGYGSSGYQSSGYDYGASGSVGANNSSEFYNNSFNNFATKSSDLSSSSYGHMGR